MSKPIVILADTEYAGYLDQLQVKFIEEQMNEIELEVITDANYFQQYFSVPRHAGVLVVSEELYHPELSKHNISYTFILSEHPDEAGPATAANVHRVRKYSSVKSIYNAVVSLCPDVFHSKEMLKTTQVIVVSSPKGGAGKTVTALGISACLAESYKKVLYLDAEQIHAFQYFFSNKATLPIAAMQRLQSSSEQVHNEIKPYLRQEMFSYLPPFPVALNAAGLTLNNFLNLIKSARESGDYDYVIVDTDSVFDDFKAALFNLADRVFLVVQQDEQSVFNAKQYLLNFNYKDSEKYLVICNQYEKERDNHLLEVSGQIMVAEYVEHSDEQIEAITQLTRFDGFQKLAYMVS